MFQHLNVHRALRASSLIASLLALSNPIEAAEWVDFRLGRSDLIIYADPALVQDAPDWQLAMPRLKAGDGADLRDKLTYFADRLAARYGQLYRLSPDQVQKLVAASRVDIVQFLRQLKSQREAWEKQQRLNPDKNVFNPRFFAPVGAGRVGGRVVVDGEFFHEQSLMRRVLSGMLDPNHEQVRAEQLRLLRREWLHSASSLELIAWIAKRCQLSRGQQARFLQLGTPPLAVAKSAHSALDQLTRLPPEEIAALLTEESRDSWHAVLQEFSEL